MKNIRSKDLEFIEYSEEYAKECHENFLSQPETAKYTLWRPTLNEIEAKEKLENWNKSVADKGVLWLIKEKQTGRIIGFVCVAETEKGVYDHLGIAIGKEFINKGYGSQTLTTLLDYIKRNDGKLVYYSHFKENDASKNLAIKCGFKFVRQDKRTRRYDKKEFDELFYELEL